MLEKSAGSQMAPFFKGGWKNPTFLKGIGKLGLVVGAAYAIPKMTEAIGGTFGRGEEGRLTGQSMISAYFGKEAFRQLAPEKMTSFLKFATQKLPAKIGKKIVASQAIGSAAPGVGNIIMGLLMAGVSMYDAYTLYHEWKNLGKASPAIQ
jgi:hypothetical protein